MKTPPAAGRSVQGTEAEIPGRKRRGTSIFSILKRVWVPLIVVATVALGGVVVDGLRGVFGSDEIFSATGSSAGLLVPFNLKRVTCEVFRK